MQKQTSQQIEVPIGIDSALDALVAISWDGWPMLMEKTQNDSDSGMATKCILGARRFMSNRSTLKHVRPNPGRLCK